MEWRKIVLSSRQVVTAEIQRIQNLFETLYLEAGSPEDMALFSSITPKRPEDCVTLYFSPGSRQFAAVIFYVYSAQPCPKPQITEVAKLVGCEDAWSLLE